MRKEFRRMEPTLAWLTEGQRRLWQELGGTPPEFVLYGGVAIALRFGHRYSADFDFFSQGEFDPRELYDSIAYLKNADVLQIGRNTLTCSVTRGEPVKVSFFGLPEFKTAQSPETVAGPGIRIASLLDLAATKASVIQKRAAARDYIDLDVLLSRGGVDLVDALAAARKAYGTFFNPQITLKALCYYEDGDLMTVPEDARARLMAEVANADLSRLVELTKDEGQK